MEGLTHILKKTKGNCTFKSNSKGVARLENINLWQEVRG